MRYEAGIARLCPTVSLFLCELQVSDPLAFPDSRFISYISSALSREEPTGGVFRRRSHVISLSDYRIPHFLRESQDGFLSLSHARGSRFCLSRPSVFVREPPSPAFRSFLRPVTLVLGEGRPESDLCLGGDSVVELRAICECKCHLRRGSVPAQDPLASRCSGACSGRLRSPFCGVCRVWEPWCSIAASPFPDQSVRVLVSARRLSAFVSVLSSA